MSVRSNYLAAALVHLCAVLAYVMVPAFALVLRGWYFPGWLLLCLIGLVISFAFRCGQCDLPVTKRALQFNGHTLYGYMFWPSRRCARCDEPFKD
jgi:hypothetical protein